MWFGDIGYFYDDNKRKFQIYSSVGERIVVGGGMFNEENELFNYLI